jgi:hypothetical protein
VEGGHQDSGSGKENTDQDLESRLAELGLRDKDKVQSLIREMLQKGYLQTDDHGTLSGGKPAVSMARLLERVFPKLPGKTLVAYFIQTIDEVLTGRKTTEVAVAHFDQTLKMQGTPLKHLKPEKTSPVQTAVNKEIENLEDVRKDMQHVQKRTHEPLTPKEEERSGYRIIGSSEDGFRYKMRDIQTDPPIAPSIPAVSSEQAQEKQPVSMEHSSLRGSEDQPVSLDMPVEHMYGSRHVSLETPSEKAPENPIAPEEAGEGTSPEITIQAPSEEQVEHEALLEPSYSKDIEALDVPPVEAEKEQQSTGEENTPGNAEEKRADAEGVFSKVGTASAAAEEQPEETGDDLIEKEIAGFQNELASLCPLCKEGKVREEKTGTGRVYFKCTNKGCNLISWGRPHHISCPICNNPFLIEMSASQERFHLQCPRATCKYQCTISQAEPLPGTSADKGSLAAVAPRRRVVRRRVVKKKK